MSHLKPSLTSLVGVSFQMEKNIKTRRSYGLVEGWFSSGIRLELVKLGYKVRDGKVKALGYSW